jgi:hypothetical protein
MDFDCEAVLIGHRVGTADRGKLMLKEIVRIVAMMAPLGLVAGCVPDEDTSPSAALFPTTYFGEVRPDFSEQLANHASREDVEFHALLGAQFAETESEELAAIRESLALGYFVHPDNGKRLYRVESIEQAQQILPTWDEERWSEELLGKFKEVPNASVAIIGLNDQRILFFDQSEQLVGIYPAAG